MEKILSIIIPTYNMEKYLDKCLTSLIISDSELMKQLEVLVVIDGAKDRSSEIAHFYQDTYPETFRVIDKENGNYGSCINRGLKEVIGKYVKVLDADDSFDNDSFITYLRHFQIMPAEVDVVFSCYRTVDEDDNIKKEYSRPFASNVLLSWIDIVGSVSNSATHTAMHELAYRRDLLIDMEYKQTEGISYTDQEWIFYPFLNAKKFFYLDLVLYNYLIGRPGQTMDFSLIIKGVPAHMTIAKRMLDWYKTCPKNVESYAYLNAAIIWFLGYLYSICLSCTVDGIRLKDLAVFDARLKNVDISLYTVLGEKVIIVCRFLKAPYIKWWRSCDDLSKLSLRNRLLIRYLSRK